MTSVAAQGALRPSTPNAMRRVLAAITFRLGRVERLRDSVRRVSARRPLTSACHQPPRELRADRRPGHRRRPGAGPCEGRRPSPRPTPRPPSDDSARRLRRLDADFARWGLMPTDSQRASQSLSNPTQRRTQPDAGPSRLDAPKCARCQPGTKRRRCRAS